MYAQYRISLYCGYYLRPLRLTPYMALFLEREQIAAGPRHQRAPRSAIFGPSPHSRAVMPRRIRHDESHGLEHADRSPLEQGTLLPPPSPALAFPTLPDVHTLLSILPLDWLFSASGHWLSGRRFLIDWRLSGRLSGRRFLLGWRLSGCRLLIGWRRF